MKVLWVRCVLSGKFCDGKVMSDEGCMRCGSFDWSGVSHRLGKNLIFHLHRSAREIWRMLVADHYASLNFMRPLLKRLQDEDPIMEGG